VAAFVGESRQKPIDEPFVNKWNLEFRAGEQTSFTVVDTNWILSFQHFVLSSWVNFEKEIIPSLLAVDEVRMVRHSFTN